MLIRNAHNLGLIGRLMGASAAVSMRCASTRSTIMPHLWNNGTKLGIPDGYAIGKAYFPPRIAGRLSGRKTGSGIVSQSATILAGGVITGTIDGDVIEITCQMYGVQRIDNNGDICLCISTVEGEQPLGKTSLTATCRIGANPSADDVASAVLDTRFVEDGLTVMQALKLISAFSAGLISISGNTVTIRNAVADSKDRIVAQTTVNGERTSITIDTSN